jgi:hypothetical protein
MQDNIIGCFEDALEFIYIKNTKIEDVRIHNKCVSALCSRETPISEHCYAYLMMHQQQINGKFTIMSKLKGVWSTPT